MVPEDINIPPDAKTVESSIGNNDIVGIVVEGEHKGVCFVRRKDGSKKILSENPFDMDVIRKMIPSYYDASTEKPI